jgi:hypothetical protein
MKNLFVNRRIDVGLGWVIIAAFSSVAGPSCGADRHPAATLTAPLAVDSTGHPTIPTSRPAPARRHRCTGSRGSSSQITRALAVDGGETLRGETEIPYSSGSADWLHLSESATIDARGWLVSARVVAARPRAPVTTYLMQPLAANVRILREGAAPVDWTVPADAPWIYRAGSSRDGMLASTPVAAWLVARASAAGPVVRVLVPERQQSYLAPVDQVAVATEKGTTVALDVDGLDIDEDFVTEARLTERRLTLVCSATAEDGPAVCPSTACSERGGVTPRARGRSALRADPARRASP